MVSTLFSETDILETHLEKFKKAQIFKYLGISFSTYAKEVRKSKHLFHACIHCSYSHNASYYANYERLEFLGDSLIYFIISDLLSKDFPDFTPYHLSVVRQKFISTQTLIERTYHIRLNELLILHPGMSITPSSRVYADIFESFVGALYLSFGIDVAKHFVEKTLYVSDLTSKITPQKDFKSIFQEIFQTTSNAKLFYDCYKDNLHNFRAQVSHCGLVYGVGSGKNRKSAEQDAAFDALKKLWILDTDVSTFFSDHQPKFSLLSSKDCGAECKTTKCSNSKQEFTLHDTIWSFNLLPQ